MIWLKHELIRNKTSHKEQRSHNGNFQLLSALHSACFDSFLLLALDQCDLTKPQPTFGYRPGWQRVEKQNSCNIVDTNIKLLRDAQGVTCTAQAEIQSIKETTGYEPKYNAWIETSDDHGV